MIKMNTTCELTLLQRSLLQNIIDETINFNSAVIGDIKDVHEPDFKMLNEYYFLADNSYIIWHQDSKLGSGYVATLKAWRLSAR